MTDLAKLVVRLEAETARYQAELEKAKRDLRGFERDTNQVVDRIAVGLGAATAAAAAGLAALFKQSIDGADALAKLARSTGLTTEALSELQYVGELSGVEDLGSSLNKLNKSIGDAATGAKAQKDAFAALGVDIRGANGQLRGTEEILNDVADAFERYADGPAKAKIAMDLFGRAGADMISFLDLGSKGFREGREEARLFGLTLTGTAAAAAEQFNDNLSRLAKIVEGRVNQGLESTVVKVAALSDEFVASGAEIGQALDRLANRETLETLQAYGIAIGAFAVANRVGPPLAALTAATYAHAASALAARSAALEMGVAVGTYSARAVAATAATRALSGALALVGGPAGAALLAAAGIYYLSTRENEAEKDTKRLKERIAELSTGLVALNESATRLELQGVRDEIRKVDDEIAKIEQRRSEAIDKMGQDRPGGFAGDAFIFRLTAETGALTEKTEDLIGKRRELLQLEQSLSGRLLEQPKKDAAEPAKPQLELPSVLEDPDKQVRKLGEHALAVMDNEEAVRAMRKEADKLVESLRTPMEIYQDTVALLNKYRTTLDETGEPILSATEYTRAFTRANEDLYKALDANEGQALETYNKMSAYADEAARNMQDAFADFLFDPFEKGLDGLLKSFLQTLQRMAANAAAAQIFEMVGSAASNSEYGWVQYIGQAIAGARADGGPVSGGSAYVVGERGPEVFVPNSNGMIVSNEKLGGDVNVAVTVNVPESTSREDSERIAREARDGIVSVIRAELVSQKRPGGLLATT